MHRTTRTALLLAVLGALGAGCSTTVTGAASPQPGAVAPPTSPSAAAPTTPAQLNGPRAETVAWVDDVCGSLLPLAEAAAVQPPIDPTDTDAAVRGLSDYLGTLTDTTDTSLSQLEDAGPSPVDGGDEVVERLSGALTIFRDKFATAKADVDAVDTSNQAEVLEALPAAIAPLEELATFPNPTEGLQSSPELDAAAAEAPNCRSLPTG